MRLMRWKGEEVDESYRLIKWISGNDKTNKSLTIYTILAVVANIICYMIRY